MAYHFDTYDNSIVIDGWEAGIADSPHQGLSDMRNCNIISVPGEVSINFALNSIGSSVKTGTVVSASAGANTVTVLAASTPLTNGQVIIFAGASLPPGITAGVKYIIGGITGSPPDYTFLIYSSYEYYLEGTPVNITDTGTGTYTTLVMGKPIHRWYDRTSGYYLFLDNNGRLWKTTSAAGAPVYLLGNDTTAQTAANGNGLCVYRGYIFVFRNNLMDYMKIADGVWVYGWNPTDVGGTGSNMNTATGTNNTHYAILNTNDRIYYCDAGYIGSFTEADGQTFDPTTAATYTWSRQAVALPSDDIANCLAELGPNLLIGGQRNAIYPWDRNGTFVGYPILIAENFIQRLVTVNTNTYIFAGQRGRIYVTNGSQANLFKKVPDHISGTIEPYFQWGDACSIRNQLYFGVSCKTSDGTAISQYGGLWAVDLDSKAIRLTNKLSYATYAGMVTVLLPIIPTPSGSPPFPDTTQGVGLFVGWDNGSSVYGIDYSSAYVYVDDEASIETDLIPIGTYDKPRDLTRIEYKLSKAMSTEGITIKYRLVFDASETGYTTVLSDKSSTNMSLSGPINFKNAQWVQFQILLDGKIGVNPADGVTYVRLKEIRITGIVQQ